jgi:hypothetical protein
MDSSGIKPKQWMANKAKSEHVFGFDVFSALDDPIETIPFALFQAP